MQRRHELKSMRTDITFSGRLLASAIFVIGKALVLEAKTQCSGTMASISLTTLCLMAMSSKTKQK